MCLPTGPLSPDIVRTGGWVGSTLESFEALYGEPTGTSTLFTEYVIEGCGAVFADQHDGFITNISFFPPRKDEDKSYLEADEADWEIAYALWIAQRFLPPDATVTQDIDLQCSDDLFQNGFSQLLLDSVPPTVYQYVSNDPAYGGFQVWFFRPLNGNGISWVSVDLQIEQVESVC